MAFISFELVGLPPTLNHMWNPVGRGRYVLSQAARRYYERTPWEIAAQVRSARLKGRISLELSMYPANCRAFDLDNRCKAIIDSMVKSGCIPDDQCIDRLVVVRKPINPAWKHGGVIVYAKENQGPGGIESA